MEKKLSLFVIMIMLFSAAAFAQVGWGTGAFGQVGVRELPRIAVYVTGDDVSENEKTALGTRMLSSLINSGRYRGIERSAAFLAEISREQKKQHSGSVDEDQITRLGRQFGVRFVCIAAITPAFGSFQVSARIVDVETAEVVYIGDASSPLKSMDDLTHVSNEVVRAMFSDKATAQAVPPPTPAVEPEPTPEPEPQLTLETESESQPALEPKPKSQQAAAPEPAAAPEAVQIAQPSERTLDDAMQDGRRRVETAPAAAAEAEVKKPGKTKFWVGVGLEVIGAGIITYGIMENENVTGHASRSKAVQSEKNRNIAYVAGTAILLSGVTLHIFF